MPLLNRNRALEVAVAGTGNIVNLKPNKRASVLAVAKQDAEQEHADIERCAAGCSISAWLSRRGQATGTGSNQTDTPTEPDRGD